MSSLIARLSHLRDYDSLLSSSMNCSQDSSKFFKKYIYWSIKVYYQVFPGGSVGKESACNVVDSGSIPGSGKSPGEGNINSLQYSCLENCMDRGAWWATVHGVTEFDRTEQLTLSLSSQYNLFTKLYQFHMYSKVNHLFIQIYPLFFFFF